MSNWLTTGQMIDQLKVGEVAELEEDKCIPTKFGPSYRHLTKLEDGDIKWCKSDGSIPSSTPLQIHGHVITWKWRILPKFVSFDEAIKAYENGLLIESYLGNSEEPWAGYSKKATMEQTITFKEILEGKWLIKEDEE